MKRFEMEIPYIKASDDIMQDMKINVGRHAEILPELKYMIGSRVLIQCQLINRERLFIKSKNPISFLKTLNGDIIHVIEMPPSHPNYPNI